MPNKIINNYIAENEIIFITFGLIVYDTIIINKRRKKKQAEILCMIILLHNIIFMVFKQTPTGLGRLSKLERSTEASPLAVGQRTRSGSSARCYCGWLAPPSPCCAPRPARRGETSRQSSTDRRARRATRTRRNRPRPRPSQSSIL